MSLRHVSSKDVKRLHAGSPRRIQVCWVDACESTNALVLESPWREQEIPFALATFNQTAGRGRQGRTWVNRPGDSLALSVVRKPTLPLDEWGWYPLVVSLAVIDAVAQVDAAVAEKLRIKWPNDILTDQGRKVAGILVEQRDRRLCIGVGINLSGEVMRLREGLAGAESLSRMQDASARTFENTDVKFEFCGILAQGIDGMLRDFENVGNARKTIKKRYAVNCLTVGSDVRIDGVGITAPYPAYASGIAPSGALVVESPEYGQHEVTVGDVHLTRTDSDNEEGTDERL